MTTGHFQAVALSLLVYAGLAVSCFGWGHAFARSLRLDREEVHVTANIWVGWAVMLFLFQGVHLVLPLSAAVVLPIFGAGAAFTLFRRKGREFAEPNDRLLRRRLSFFVLGGMLLGLSCWFASRAMLPILVADSGLYHLNSIRWVNEFSIIPGLGNLHGRLAFNQSFFNFVAALNFYPFFGHGRSLANSFVFLLLLATITEFMLPLLRKPGAILQAHPFYYLPGLLILPALGFLAFHIVLVASPTPNLTSTLLQFAIYLYLFRWIIATGKTNAGPGHTEVLIVVLAATALTIKLSNAVFSLVTILLILAYQAGTGSNWRKAVFSLIVPCAAIFALHGLRGYLLSGTPLYPSTLGYFPLDWAVPLERIQSEANAVTGWARQPGPGYQEALHGWAWFGPWLEKSLKQFAQFTWPLVATGLFLAATPLVRVFGGKPARRPQLLIFVPIVSGLIFWFLAGPSLRFAHALLFLLPVSAALLLLNSFRGLVAGTRQAVIYFVVFVTCNLSLLSFMFEHPWNPLRVSKSGFGPIKEVPLTTRVTRSGLAVYIPETGNQVWDSPLPATPYFNPQLRLRREGDLSSGFTLDKDQRSDK